MGKSSDVAAAVTIINNDPQRSLTHRDKSRDDAFRVDDVSLSPQEVFGWYIDGKVGWLRGNYDIVLIDSPPHA